jgi:PAS domain S-box-containing protein
MKNTCLKDAIDKRNRRGKLNQELAAGLAEVIDALKGLAAGDPSVRVPEASDIEIVQQLKQLVNTSAEYLSDIVDLAHEFAIGLAEHFDVLHRVAAGDLSARVNGLSTVELLESLKEITNQTIESVAREITDHQQTEKNLRESELLFRTFAERAPIGITIMRPDLTFEYINPTFTHIFGYSQEDIPNKTIWFEKAYPNPAYQREVKSFWEKEFVTPTAIGQSKDRTFEVRCKNGEDKIISFKSTTLTDGRHFVIYSDITEKAKAEEKRRLLEAQLQRSQKMEALGTLAGAVAHDLNNILSGIVSYPELLLMDLSEESPLRKPIQLIRRSGRKAAAIVQDLLTLARRGIADSKVINLNQIITEFLNSAEYENLIKFHPRVTVELNLAPTLHNINASPVHIAKTVMNLVTNAAEAMPDGGKLIITTANRYVDNPMKGYDEVLEGNYATLMVTDTGIGIPDTDLDKIYEPFYTKKVMGRSGTGLGMAVVWGTVKDHHGYIDVRSVENHGTTFTLYFPATGEIPHEKMGQLTLEDYRGRGETILLVDDMADQREIASAMLTKLGYHAYTAASGEEALGYLKDNPVDLLILDMIMKPGMDGLETYQRVLEIRPNQKAIATSGYSLSQRAREIQKLGATIYLKKPYSLESLGMAIRSELEK